MFRRTSLIILAAAGMSLWSVSPASAAVLIKAKGVACTSGGAKFVPKTLTVDEGTTVKWKSSCGKHSVTAFGGGWSKNTTILAGESTTSTFNGDGVYRYRCRFHSDLLQGDCFGMCGNVRVR